MPAAGAVEYRRCVPQAIQRGTKLDLSSPGSIRMLQVGVIGAGYWGKNLVRNFASLPDAELNYICDVKDDVRRKMADLYPDARRP